MIRLENLQVLAFLVLFLVMEITLAQNQSTWSSKFTNLHDEEKEFTKPFDDPFGKNKASDGKREKVQGKGSSDDSSRNNNHDSGFDVYQNKIELMRKVKEGRKAIRQTLRSSTSEKCDWQVSPIKYLKGEYCGKHYKIFGLNRHQQHLLNDTKEIKQRYRKMSLLIHPDKNPSPDAPEAFSLLTEGYNCLTDNECKDKYDDKLVNLEQQEKMKREGQLKYAMTYIQQSLEQMFYYMSWVANSIDQAYSSIWMKFEGLELLDMPVGKIGMMLMLIIFRNPLLYLVGFSKGFISLNSYLAELQYSRQRMKYY